MNDEDSMVTMRPGSGPAVGRVDQYDLVRKLGGGGFGVVWLARDTASGMDVALKTLHPLLKNSPEEMETLREKFVLAARLSHPNLAPALVLHPVREVSVPDEAARRELRLSPGDSVMVMRYAPGVTLSKWRRQFPGGVVPPDRALEVGRQIAAALDYAHSEKIVHRDVKPSNVMVETLGGASRPGEPMPPSGSAGTPRPTEDVPPRVRVRLLDFGLAAEIRSSMSRVSTEKGDTSGTRPYMAPEQWTGRRQDGRTDQYALGCVLYELLSGAPPFAGVFETGDPVIMKDAVIRDAPEQIEDLSDAANAALLRALAKEPKDRFPTCGAFVESLARGVRGAESHAEIAESAEAGEPVAVPRSVALARAQAAELIRQGDLEGAQAFLDLAKRLSEGGGAAAGGGAEADNAPDRRSGFAEGRTAGERTVVKAGSSEIALRWCPPGSFTMGSPETEAGRYNDETQHRVTLTRGFWMGETEVTQGLWKEFMGNNPSNNKSGDDHPVECVSWNDCQEFLTKLNAKAPSGWRFALPAEAQWEYAGRAGTTGAYDGTGRLDDMGWYTANSGDATHPVGRKAANAWGLRDMHGNVWEWCADGYETYPSGAATDPTGPASGDDRVLRGGSYWYGPQDCRSASRYRRDPDDRDRDFGFRLAAFQDGT